MSQVYCVDREELREDDVLADICGLPELFNQAMADRGDELRSMIDQHVSIVNTNVEQRFASKAEHDAVEESERFAMGRKIFRGEILPRLEQEAGQLDLFGQFMYWMNSAWWYEDLELRQRLYFDTSKVAKALYRSTVMLMQELLIPLLPANVRRALQSMECLDVAMNSGHFAILFVHKNGHVRRIITDQHLMELHGVYGYVYMDIAAEGMPVARCCCDHGGERAFFDGVRLMAHNSFRTCAPATFMVDGGYKVNSTRCTIVNGQLFPLIDAEDKVAQTTGAFMGMVDFSFQEAIDARKLSQKSATRINAAGDIITLDGEPLKPVGIFQPSETELLDNGFTLYRWSEFQECFVSKFSNVMVVDDSKQWITRVQNAFAAEDLKVHTLQTRGRKVALRNILDQQPEAVLLDMHLTRDEGFEGLWIANQLLAAGFEGRIIITSGYPEQHLRAMQLLIKGETCAPGKDPVKIKRCLAGKCRCNDTNC